MLQHIGILFPPQYFFILFSKWITQNWVASLLRTPIMPSHTADLLIILNGKQQEQNLVKGGFTAGPLYWTALVWFTSNKLVTQRKYQSNTSPLKRSIATLKCPCVALQWFNVSPWCSDLQVFSGTSWHHCWVLLQVRQTHTSDHTRQLWGRGGTGGNT